MASRELQKAVNSILDDLRSQHATRQFRGTSKVTLAVVLCSLTCLSSSSSLRFGAHHAPAPSRIYFVASCVAGAFCAVICNIASQKHKIPFFFSPYFFSPSSPHTTRPHDTQVSKLLRAPQRELEWESDQVIDAVVKV